MNLPLMTKIHQRFDTQPITQISHALHLELQQLNLAERILPGQTVAITAGSRGIANIVTVLSGIVRELKAIGAQPFLVPSMGSHGGATAEGQVKLLAGYGITEESVGAPIRSDMTVVEVGRSNLGLPVYLDKQAFLSDHIVVVNRVKPHTDFKAPIESGLVKMMTIGLGKQKGAEQYHNAVIEHGYYQTLMAHSEVILANAPVSFGVALVENQLDETQIIKAAWRENMLDMEVELQKQSKVLLPRLPFKEIDLLIVDEMGKDISGTCMDQNVIARTVIRVGTAPTEPRIRRIFARDLTPKSQGMATGIGNADFVTTRLVNKMDRNATYMNCLSACEPEMAAIPPYYDTDREVLERALLTIGLVTPEMSKIVHIRNTLCLDAMLISDALIPEIERNGQLDIVAEPRPFFFGDDDNLISQWPTSGH